MAAPIPLHQDFDASQLRNLAQEKQRRPSGPAAFGACGDL
jgi:hypothetical protein